MDEFNLKRKDVIWTLIFLFIISSLSIIYLYGKYLLPMVDALIFSLPLLYIQEKMAIFTTKNTTILMRIQSFFKNPSLIISYIFVSLIIIKELGWIGVISLNIIVIPLYLFFSGKWISNSRSSFIICFLFLSSITSLIIYQVGTEIRSLATEVMSLKGFGFKKYESVIGILYGYLESIFIKYTKKTFIEFANETANKLQIKTIIPSSTDSFAKISYILSLFLKFKESDAFKNILNTAKKSINSDVAIKVASIALDTMYFIIIQFNNTFEMLVMIITFFSTLFHMTRSKRSQEIALFNKIFEDYHPLTQKIKLSITFILSNLIHQTWLELSGSYIIFSLGGSMLPAFWSILASILTIFPIFNILIICALVIFELVVRKMYYNALGVVICYLMYQFFVVPKSVVPFSKGYLSSLIGVSIATGYYTFGIHGILLGPLITSIPGILFELTETYSDLIKSPISMEKEKIKEVTCIIEETIGIIEEATSKPEKATGKIDNKIEDKTIDIKGSKDDIKESLLSSDVVKSGTNASSSASNLKKTKKKPSNSSWLFF